MRVSPFRPTASAACTKTTSSSPPAAIAWFRSVDTKSHDLIRQLEAAVWVLDRVRGSHHVFKHPDRPGSVVIPHPRKDLGKGLVAAILKAGL
ncbi:type II toxin-antitoxin system HicA family toxin [Lichenicoccus sp.]|uniref:type II toxin-antitoxin system HicA family toxin n=1 Tax=Lichenicoccus sp. TaxID=2781899 RepID=UPI003D0F8E4B